MTLRRIGILLAIVMSNIGPAAALEPPTREQLERYRKDGTLAERVTAARSFGNHRMSDELAARVAVQPGVAAKVRHEGSKRLPSTGNRRVFALLLSFSDYPGHTDAAQIDDQLFGEGVPAEFPYESLAGFYRRSSYGLLEIEGATLGWYQTDYPRSSVPETTDGREDLILEAITHFDTEGHDFTQYDNDDDGSIDYFLVIWAGPHGEWAEFWWGYQTSFWGNAVVDGKQLGTYSWQWEGWNYPSPFSPAVAIHETGHALGLPDYYDYDESIGPSGGVGGLDQMDGNWGDHNCFSKYVLGWLTPESHNQGSHVVALGASDETPEALLVMHGDPVEDPYAEYFMVQLRRRQGNDADIPTDGLLIWHVDARLSEWGGFLYDNSYSDHKLLRLMEADGLEEIVRGIGADSDDFYQPGDIFGPNTTPNSHRHDGWTTNIYIEDIVADEGSWSLMADLGSGCAMFCETSADTTVWPRVAVPFQATVSTENCDGPATYQWSFGDGTMSDEPSPMHAYGVPGTYEWQLTGQAADASCSRSGSILACRDLRCWRWNQANAMTDARAMHASVRLDDGRVLVVGGLGGPEIHDPIENTWQPTGPMTDVFESAVAVRLTDGRVLAVGNILDSSVNAQIYDPSSDTWTLPDQMTESRVYHSAVGLPDGRVLVAGGFAVNEYGAYSDIVEAEIFDPVSESWTDAGSIGESMMLPGLTPLTDGTIYLTGNQSAMIFDPRSHTWTDAGRLIFEATYHFAVPLLDGRVLVGGGIGSNRTIIYDPLNGTWAIGGLLSQARIYATATVLDTGHVLVTGGAGMNGEVIATAEIFDPVTSAWTEVSLMSEARLAHQATLLIDGSVLITGGVHSINSEQSTNAVERFAKPELPPRMPGGRVP